MFKFIKGYKWSFQLFLINTKIGKIYLSNIIEVIHFNLKNKKLVQKEYLLFMNTNSNGI